MQTANIMPYGIQQSLTKIFIFSLLASVVTFGLFVLMDVLTRIEDTPPTEPVAYIPISAVMEKPKLEKARTNTIPDPPKAVTPPPRSKIEPEQIHDIPGSGQDYSPHIPKGNYGKDSLVSFAPSDNNAVPIVRIEPKYPIEAARDGVEGWVKLSFDINALGQVENVRVLDAEPTRMFEREAKRALLRWKYKAKVIEGKAIRQSGQVVMLSFNLNS